MSSRIDLTLQPCRALAIMLSSGWLMLALGLSLAAYRTSPWLLAALPVLTFAGWHSVRRQALLAGRRAVRTIHVDRDKLRVETINGDSEQVRVSGNSRLFGHLALLKFYSANSTNNAYTVILIDTFLIRNVDRDAFRRLRVWLRFARSHRNDTTTSPL